MRGVLEIPTDLEPVQAVIISALERVEDRFRQQLATDLAPVASLLNHVERYRGKMLRPVIVLLSALAAHPRAADGPADEHITEPHIVTAAVCEMVHMATLVHDDVLDEADARRGGATINALHGNEAAVMLGDYLIAAAYELCTQLGDTHTAGEVGRMAMAMCAGELLQLHHRRNWSLTEPDYYAIVTRKTAELIAVAAELGATHSGAPPAARKALRAFATDLGIAFQIQDDLLDLTGDQSVVGKSLGKDLEKGKLTLPVIHHLAACTPDARAASLTLIEQAAAESPDPNAASTLAARLADTASTDYARNEAARLVARARDALTTLSHSAARDTLDLLAQAVITRDR